MEGKRERLPVQRIVPLLDEQPDVALKDSYARILKATNDDVFKVGEFHLFDPQVYGAIGVIRNDMKRVVAYLGQISDAWHRFNGPQLNVTAIARAAGAQTRLRLVNLLNSSSVTVQEIDGNFRIETSRLGIDDDGEFCLIEAFPA
jgi:hypothetical protein